MKKQAKKHTVKRLVISRETLRALSSDQAKAVRGVGPTALNMCKRDETGRCE